MTAQRNHPTALQSFFSPASVALVGATDREGSVGRTVLANLLSGAFHGRVYAINPGRKAVLGIPCYQKITEVPERVDLAVVVTPAPTVPDVIRDCVTAGVASAIVISAGFKEKGSDGAELERRSKLELRGSPMRVVGPNCLGMMNPRLGLNATFARDIARSGNVAFLSQSGALLTAILDWSSREQVGFSAIVSTGSMLDVGWGIWSPFLERTHRHRASSCTWNQLEMRVRFYPRRAPWPSINRSLSSRPADRKRLRKLRPRIQERSRVATKCLTLRSADVEFFACRVFLTCSPWRKC